jgi:predicted peroxiredoxin/TusA-related sulfurtransferase
METIAAAASIDRRGKTITTFVVFDAAAELERIRVGDVLEILTDDFEPFSPDVTAWCGAAGHTLIVDELVAEGRRFLIRKGAPIQRDTRLAMVISSDGLEELLSPLGFALAAALEGIHVGLYLQGPGVRVLQRGFRPKLRGWSRPFTRFAAAGLTKAGHLPAQEKLRQLHTLGAEIYLCGPSMDHFKVTKTDLILDGLPQVEYLTFMAEMADADIHIYA